MKQTKSLILLIMLLITALETEAKSTESSVPRDFWGAITYNINDPEIVVDAYLNLAPYESINVNNGIVSWCEINGNHLYLTISQDNFMDHIYNQYKNQGYWDLEINIMYGGSPSWSGAVPVLSRIVIIRIVF